MSVTIYHNPACGTSRNVLGLIRNSGEAPTIIEYLVTPPSREELEGLIRHMGVPVRDVLRQKGTPYAELGLDDPSLTDDQLLNAMMARPILINRPIVVTPLGVKLCRPSEAVLDLLPNPQRGAFAKEDGEPVRFDGMFHPAGSNLTMAEARSSRINAFGTRYEGKTGLSTSEFTWAA